MKRILFFLLFGALILLIPFIIQQLIQYRQLPKSITIVTGQEGGRYKDIAVAIGRKIEAEHGIKVKYIVSPGSQKNINFIQNGEADFAFFQPNVIKDTSEFPDVRMITNVFPEVVLTHVKKDLKYDPFIGELKDRENTIIAVGEEWSGSAVNSETILNHFDNSSLIGTRVTKNYEEVIKGFELGDLDMAIVTTEENASIQKRIAATGKTKLMELPFAESFVAKNPEFHLHEIPSGFYRVFPEPYPVQKTIVIAVNAQLITNSSVSASMVTAVAEALMDPEFLSTNRLNDLRSGGNNYARSNPSIPFHSGANHFYDPEIKPFLNPDFVDSTESLRSFFVSILIALYLVFRWLRNKSRMSEDHHLDKYVRRLLDIEQEQVDLDEGGTDGDETLKLEELLDEVTGLRREALISFSANELRDDAGVECFLMLSSSLSEKINAKLTRQRLCSQIALLRNTVSSPDSR
jgi:TRAP transporter TAXI family solute receptor